MAEMSQEPKGSFTQAKKEETPIYEVGFHVIPSVGDAGVSAVVEKIRKAIGEAEFISEGFPQKMTLAYRIERATSGKREKYTESYFGWIKFATSRERAQEFQQALAGIHEVMRSLVIETVREDVSLQPRRAVFSSDRLEGETIAAPKRVAEKAGEVSEEELDKSIDAIVS